ncbi:hypothetical protein D9M71_823170 [compost metagenome]
MTLLNTRLPLTSSRVPGSAGLGAYLKLISKAALVADSDTQVTDCDEMAVPPTVPLRLMGVKSESEAE